MKGLQIGLPPLAVLSRGTHRFEPDRHQRAERRIDRRLGCVILQNGYSPLRRLSSLLGWKTHHTLSFQLFQQDQTRLDLVFAIRRFPIQVFTQRPGQLGSAQLRESLDNLLHLGELLAGESAPAKSCPQQRLDGFHRVYLAKNTPERSSANLQNPPHHRTTFPDQYFTLSR